MAKNTHYVVWQGRTPGIYTAWPEAEAQVKGFPGAKFKGFPNKAAADAAYGVVSSNTDTQVAPVTYPVGRPANRHPAPGRPTGTYLAVDAAFSANSTNILEWRGVLVEDEKQTEVFRSSPYQGGSANVGEYLAIVQGIQYLTENNLSMRLYSDSYNAQKWVRDRAHRSNVSASDALKTLLSKANSFLSMGGYTDVAHLIPIKDWKSKEWNDIPADFNRKGRSANRIAAADGPAL